MFMDIESSGPSVAVGSAMQIEGKAPTVAAVRTFMAERIKEMPRFRQRVVSSRTKVRSPKWVDAEPDLSHHISGVKLKAGDSIDATISKLMETPLDRTRPLWDAMVISGYSTEQWTFVVRLHHSIADGQGAVILLGHLIDLDPKGSMNLADVIAATEYAKPEADTEIDVPDGRLEALGAKAVKAIEASFETIGEFISTYPDTFRTTIAMAPRKPTGLTGSVSAQRRWVGAHYSLTDIKTARKSFKGVTINDMVLGSVAYGFGKLLESRGEDPSGRTVRAVMPVSLRKTMESNNQVSLLPAPLPVGEKDAIKRMKTIRDATKHAKRSMAPVIGDKVMDVVNAVAPANVTEFIVSNSGGATKYFTETLVTNVPGPAITLYFMGQETLSNTPIIPIEGSMRIIIGITSYKDSFNVGITGDGEYAADVDVLLAGILEGFDELVELAAAKTA